MSLHVVSSRATSATAFARRPGHRGTSVSSARNLAAGRSQLLQSASPSAFLAGTPVRLRQPLPPLSAVNGAYGARANLFSRFFRVVRSYANSFVGNFEDPEKLLDQTVNEMQADVVKMRQASAQVLASQKQLQTKYDQAKKSSDDWYRRAQLAVDRGDDELAREALKRRKGFEETAKMVKVQMDAQQKAVDQLVGNTRILENKLTEARSKKETLKARAKSAQSSKEINEMLQGLSTSNATAAFDKMEQKVNALEAESQAIMQLGTTNDDVETRFAALEGDDVDGELSALKRGALKGQRQSPRNSLPQGRPLRDAIDFELEELRQKARD